MKDEVCLDVCKVSPRERHPLIFKTWENLPVGGVMKLINDHDPKPLFYEFKAERAGEFEWSAADRGPKIWSVLIKRIAPNKHASTLDGVDKAPHWAENSRVHPVDVREDLRKGEEPFAKIMAASLDVQEGEVLLLRVSFEPFPLYKVLESKGFEHWAKKIGEENWEVYFYKKPA